MRRVLLTGSRWVLVASWLACTGGGAAVPPGDPEESDPEIVVLERARQRSPSDGRTLAALASRYFDRARKALPAGDQATYRESLRRAQALWVRAVELDPGRADGHNGLGLISAYVNDLEGARRSFFLASKLDRRSPVLQLNLAEVAVYQGKGPEVRGRLRLARQRGGHPAEIELIRVLDAWRGGDVVEAQKLFGEAKEAGASRVRTWNGGSDIETFADFAAHCCKLAFCGPYMVKACGDVGEAVVAQKREEETVLEELRLEMERARVYERQRALEIEVEEDEEADERGAP